MHGLFVKVMIPVECMRKLNVINKHGEWWVWCEGTCKDGSINGLPKADC